MEIKEFEIPVPWGHVAVKAWGVETNTPVLTIHGVSDNVGSFDRLIPHLPDTFYYICIDLPGHGRSSPYPPYLLITALNTILTMKLVVDYLNRKEYIIMGHSWGGQCAILFTQLYPEYILKLVVLDCFYLFPIEAKNFKESLRTRIDGLIKLSKNTANRKPAYFTYNDAINKMIDGRFAGMVLSKEAAEPIANRGLVDQGNGLYSFAVDPRMRYFTNLMTSFEYLGEIVNKYPLVCPVLIIYCSDSDFQYYVLKSVVNEYQKCKNISIVQVHGSHDVHNNTPEIVAPLVSTFLTSIASKL
ncbi:hypothetical protein PPYR_06669 [Photinus pyralis]|uniref:AB hydrolase-1 domain-containing protein n=1 Tax=Photinus pyralis TaxID=7054 RepID=A0A5N4AN83_PHOPY|nr:serine hydrolase-like protein [Photinus pyralis]KAB0798789.1 hypothetical protein PPYR_06669 [Photinus pyralis]